MLRSSRRFSCEQLADEIVMHTSGHSGSIALLPQNCSYAYIVEMHSQINRSDEASKALLAEWHSLHPEFTDEEFDEAMRELRRYLRLAWAAYRHLHPELDIPDEL
jgi:hypothetical protein